MISSNKQIELSKYRLEQARVAQQDAEQLYARSSYSGSNNRAYYAIFGAARALLALDGVDYKRHSGVISHFQKEYVKTGLFPVEFSKIITSASLIRTASDYEDFFIASKVESLEQVENSKRFCDAVEAYLRPLWNKS